MNERTYSLAQYVLAALVTALSVSGLMLTASCSEIASDQLEPPNVVWVDMQANLPRDDEGTENLGEDDPGWDCQTMGNQVCGYTDPSSGTLYRYYYGV
jgi:hypothetical protein